MPLGPLGYGLYSAAVAFSPLAIGLAEAHPDTVLALAYHLRGSYYACLFPFDHGGRAGGMAKPLALFVRNTAWQGPGAWPSTIEVQNIPGSTRPLLNVKFLDGASTVLAGFMHTSHGDRNEGVALQTVAAAKTQTNIAGTEFILGDFNVHIDDPAVLQSLTAALPADRTILAPQSDLNNAHTHVTTVAGRERWSTIDFALVRRRGRVQATCYVSSRRGGSDHRPILMLL